jgi:hypothetical protein
MSAAAPVLLDKKLATQIDEARSHGYSDEDILGHLSKSDTTLAPRISEARQNGYNPDEILGAVTKYSPRATTKIPIPEALQQPEDEGLLKRIYLAPARALTEDLPAAIAQFTREGKDAKAGAASKLLRSIATVAAPFTLPEALVAAPAMTALSLGTGALGGAAAEGTARMAGVPEGTSALIGDAGSAIGGGLPSLVRATGVGPRINAGSKEALAEVKKELPDIKKWQKYGTAGGAVIGYSVGHPFVGSEAGAVAGSARAIPPAVRGFKRGFSDYQPPLTEAMPPPPGTPAARFVPGQYDAPTLQRPPVEVGGAHIPDYHGPVAGEPPLPTPAAPAATSAQALNDVAAKLKATAKNLGAKNFGDLPDTVQKTVIADMVKRGEMPAPPGTLPTPGIIPEGEHNIIRRVAETNRGAKDTAIARSLKDEGITADTFDRMSDVDLQKRVRDLGYRPSTGKNYSRTWQAFKRDLRQLLD